MPDLEERVAALEAIVAKLLHKALASGDITINDARAAHGLPPFPDLEPGFMSEARMDESRDDGTTVWVRLTHLPTGVTVQAQTREEAVAKLGRAIERRARRRETPARDFPPILAAPIPVRTEPEP